MARKVRSKPATADYRKGFDAIKWPKRPRRGTWSYGSAQKGDTHRSRARMASLGDRPTPMRKMTDGVRRATRVLGLAESPKERDMFRSLLATDGQQANPSEIRAALHEVRVRKGW